MIDTHCHLFLPEFDQDRNKVVENCISAGVEKMINPNVDDTTLIELKNLCDLYPQNILAAFGLHPCSVKSDFKEKICFIQNFAKSTSYIAIGEIGIDLYWDTSTYKEQIEALEIQCDWAVKSHLPVIIHTRNSFEQTWEVLKSFSQLRGVFHAFTGDVSQALQAIGRSFYIGIGGIVTFKNSQLSQTLQHIPLEYILLETDSPYLAPVPFRGKRNQPSYLTYIIEKIAQVKNISSEEVVEHTTLNAKRLFNI